MAQAERAAADKVASTTVEAQKAQEAATASVARAKAVIERCDELRAESERDRNAAKRASTRASECLALAEARAVELVQAHQGARRLEEERDETKQHLVLVGQHHHALSAHAAALHAALSHGSTKGLGAEQIALLLATSQLLQRSIQQLRHRHEEIINGLVKSAAAAASSSESEPPKQLKPPPAPPPPPIANGDSITTTTMAVVEASASSSAATVPPSPLKTDSLIAALERREAQAVAAAAASDAQRWRAEAAAAERSRQATEEAAQQRAHVAVAEVARWRAEAEAADAARRAAEKSLVASTSSSPQGSALPPVTPHGVEPARGAFSPSLSVSTPDVSSLMPRTPGIPPPSTGKLDEELARIDDQIESLQAALLSAPQ